MDICEYIKKIKMVIQTENDYDKYRYIFKEYIQYLEDILKNNPSNIKAVCQLAIMYFEDRRDTDICIHLMEDAITKYEARMSKDSLCELLNNLAFFYDAEYEDDLKAEQALKRAVELKSMYQNSYYALAYLTADTEPSYAMDVINNIPQKEKLPIHYKYLFAYILMKNALYEDALVILEALTRCDDIEISERSLYNCAIIYSVIGKVKEACTIADKLYKGYKEEKNEEILTYELIYLFFALQDFEKVVELFTTEKMENIYVDVHVIKLYFFALKALGLGAECEKAFLSKVDEIKNDIHEVKSDEDYTESEKVVYIKANERDLEILYQNYSDVTLNNIIVELEDIFYYCKARKVCYLIDCPRHS